MSTPCPPASHCWQVQRKWRQVLRLCCLQRKELETMDKPLQDRKRLCVGTRERTQLPAQHPCWPPPRPPLSAPTSSVHPFASPTAIPMGSHHAAVITQVCCLHLSMELQAGTPVFSGLSRETELTDVYIGRDLSQGISSHDDGS